MLLLVLVSMLVSMLVSLLVLVRVLGVSVIGRGWVGVMVRIGVMVTGTSGLGLVLRYLRIRVRVCVGYLRLANQRSTRESCLP